MSKTAQLNWDDMRYVVAVADHGSVAAAAKVLGVNHATVLRRIAAFETGRGVRFFEKTRRGYRVLADRRAVVEAMREAAAAFDQVEHAIDAERPVLQGGLRITSTDALCHTLLPAALAEVSRQTGVAFDVISDNAHLDLERFEAHVTVRPAMALPPELEGEIAAQCRFALYAAPDTDRGLLQLSGPPARSAAGIWLRKQGPSELSADSFVTLAGLGAAGIGRVLLPCFLGDGWPGLTRLSMVDEIAPVPIWVASHKDYAQSGRLRRVRAVLVDELERQEPRMMGAQA